MKNINAKTGISLISLIVTIVIMITLVSIIAINVNSSFEDTAKLEYLNELKKISDEVEIYKISYVKYPSQNIDGKEFLSKSELLSYIDTQNSSILSEEFLLNKEPDDSIFYAIDLKKLNILNMSKGYSKDKEDIFVVSSKTSEIYYLKGIKIGKEKYFGFTSKLTQKSENILSDENRDGDFKNSTIYIYKNTNLWTNNLKLKLKINVSETERVYLKLPNIDTEFEVETTNFKNETEFELEKLLKNIYTGSTKVMKESITSKMYDEFCKKISNERYMKVIKKEHATGKILEEKNIDISNFEANIPSIESVQKKDLETYKKINIKVADDLNNKYFSGIYEVRYEYLTKIDNTKEVSYYNTNFDITNITYMKNSAKIAEKETEDNFSFIAPKNIIKIAVLVIDKAGNYIIQKNIEI